MTPICVGFRSTKSAWHNAYFDVPLILDARGTVSDGMSVAGENPRCDISEMNDDSWTDDIPDGSATVLLVGGRTATKIGVTFVIPRFSFLFSSGK